MLALTIIRLAMLPIAMIGVINAYAVEMVWRYGAPTPFNPQPIPADLLYFDWLGNYALLAVLSAVALSLLEVFTCTALGIATIALLRSTALSILLATAIRGIPIVAGMVIAWLDGTVDFTSPFALFRHRAAAIADLGTAPLSRLVVPYMEWSQTTHADAAETLYVVYALILIMCLASVLIAYIAIRFGGAKTAQRGGIRGFRNRVKWRQL
jgi:hypothetical protein